MWGSEKKLNFLDPVDLKREMAESSSPKSPESSESVEYEQCYSANLFSDVAGTDFKKFDGVYLQTYGGGPEGGYLFSADGFIYEAHRDWLIPFTLKKIEGTFVINTENPDLIRMLKEGEEPTEDETEFEWEEWHQEKWAKAKENYDEYYETEAEAELIAELDAAELDASSSPTKTVVPKSKNHVRVTHTMDFNVPDDLDLNDETQVVQWNVKDKLLYIKKADGSELFIDPRDEGDFEVAFEEEGVDF